MFILHTVKFFGINKNMERGINQLRGNCCFYSDSNKFCDDKKMTN